MILVAVPSRAGASIAMIRTSLITAALILSCCTVLAQTPAGQAPPAPAAPAGPAVESTDGAELAEFQKIEDAWSDAVNRKDQYGLELVLSPLFIDVSASGDITTRNQQVVQVINNEDKTLYLTQKVIAVRLLGDTAVANGTYTLHHKTSAGPVDEKGVFTHVFLRVRGGWLCVNSQRTLLQAMAKAKPSKKQSTAEEPFHIPFFSKSDKNNNQ